MGKELGPPAGWAAKLPHHTNGIGILLLIEERNTSSQARERIVREWPTHQAGFCTRIDYRNAYIVV